MLGTMLLLCVGQGSVCGDCSLLRDGRVSLCSVHLDAERQALTETRKPLASGLASERIAALESLGHLADSHVNAPSDRIARRIAAALEDESLAVRTRAVQLLGRPQHALVCMESLLDALAASEKELRSVLPKEKALQEKIWSGHGTQKQRDKLALDLATSQRTHESLVAWRRVLLTQLGQFPDENVVTALCSLARPVMATPAEAREIDDAFEKMVAYRAAVQRLPDVMDVNGPLVRIGSSATIGTVIDNLSVLQAEIEELAQWSSFREVSKPLLQGLRDARDRSLEDIGSALRERGARDVPERLGLDSLLDWLRIHRESFPEGLAGVDSPAW